jgi:hypothetical protein
MKGEIVLHFDRWFGSSQIKFDANKNVKPIQL